MSTNYAYTHGASSIPLLGETIDENLKKTVEKYPDQEALICAHQNYRATYREFYEQVIQVAKGLIEAFKTLQTNLPIVIRLTGTNEKEGRELLKGTSFIVAETMSEAGRKAVEAAR